jgi:hypothetical protein
VCGTTGSNDFGTEFIPGAEESDQQLLKELESIVQKTNLETSETKKDKVDRNQTRKEITSFMADPTAESKKHISKRKEAPAQAFGGRRKAPSEERFDNREYQEKMDEKLLKML